MIIYFEITFIFDLYCNPIVFRTFGKRTLSRVNIIERAHYLRILRYISQMVFNDIDQKDKSRGVVLS